MEVGSRLGSLEARRRTSKTPHSFGGGGAISFVWFAESLLQPLPSPVRLGGSGVESVPSLDKLRGILSHLRNICTKCSLYRIL